MRTVVLSLTLLATVNVVNAENPKQPKLLIKERLCNFGTIKQHTKTTHSFISSNTGQKPLVIKHLHSTCGCTAALTTKEKIEPRESAKIDVTFSSGYRKGRVTKCVYVESNNPDEPLVKLTVTGIMEVVSSPQISVNPSNIDFGIIWIADKIKSELNVKHTGNVDLVIEEITGPPTKGYIMDASWLYAIYSRILAQAPYGK